MNILTAKTLRCKEERIMWNTLKELVFRGGCFYLLILWGFATLRLNHVFNFKELFRVLVVKFSRHSLIRLINSLHAYRKAHQTSQTYCETLVLPVRKLQPLLEPG